MTTLTSKLRDALDMANRLDQIISELTSPDFLRPAAYDAVAYALGPDRWELFQDGITRSLQESAEAVVARIMAGAIERESEPTDG